MGQLREGESKPIIYWFRRDFRLADHPGIAAAAKSGRPIIPVFILDEVVESYGAAPKWRLHQSIKQFASTLEQMGSMLILRRGDAATVLSQLAKETGAGDIWWTRLYDPETIPRDRLVKKTFAESRLDARSFPGHILFEPWEVSTKAGTPFKVYSPMWRAVRNLDVSFPEAAPSCLPRPSRWPASESLDNWFLTRPMNRGGNVVGRYSVVGEDRALDRLNSFLMDRVEDYGKLRDVPSVEGTSRLSENLAWGEIGPRTIWHATQRALAEGKAGAEVFLKELVWREFAYHLIYNTPRITTRNWRSEWDSFPWSENEDDAVLKWKQGRTGIPLVDAAMRELYVTGTMHNRGRMIAGSFLTKHMMKHWRIGLRWFEECLIDWDPAANAMGWQWVSGSGPDASPFFRIFNPETQAQKFDKDKTYVERFVGELTQKPSRHALDFFAACPRAWKLGIDTAYPQPLLDLAEGRTKALQAYSGRKEDNR